MMNCGLLYIRESAILGQTSFVPILQSCIQFATDKLYVHLRPATPQFSSSSLFDKISQFYIASVIVKADLDLRFLLGHLKKPSELQIVCPKFPERPVDVWGSFNIDTVLTDDPSTIPTVLWSRKIINLTDTETFPREPSGCSELSQVSQESVWKTYRNVVIGGTFDHIHAGHKILLTNAILRCQKKLTIGLTKQEMLKKKRLADLIQPLEVREQLLRELCTELDPSLEYHIEAISDPFGPSIVDEALEAVVASQETEEGAKAINVERHKKGLSKLDIHIFPLHDVKGSTEDVRTMSSSWTRQQMLGKLLRPPKPQSSLPKSPYLIGLTGGSGSGKSSIGKYLAEKSGVLHVDCDKIAHEAYRKGSVLYDRLVAEYGTGIIDTGNGEIMRRELGKVVFNNEGARQRLNSLVWPEVMNYCLTKVNDTKPAVAVFDAALLVEAGWADSLHEIWVTFVPEDEAVRRILERDSVDEESARKRLQTQLSNRQRIGEANVVFCSSWDYSATRAQVDRAWTDLLKRI